MADYSCSYTGSWKIVEFISMDEQVEAMEIEGTVFNLDDSGDVQWTVSEGGEQLPFFCSETYEIFHSSQPTLKLFGSDESHMFEFKMELSGDLLLLTYDNFFMLQCQRAPRNEPANDLHFSFLNALEEGYFSDLTLVADTGKEFKVHKTILFLSIPQVHWNQASLLLANLPEDVLTTALHYLYSACLPTAITEDTAKRCIKTMEKIPGFSQFCDLCEMFLKITALKQQIITLVNDMHISANRIIEYFNDRTNESSNNSPSHGTGTGSGSGGTGDLLAYNPAKLYFVMKQALRECAVAGAKFMILCDLFAKRKNELSRAERHEIIKYAKSRLPIFMQQLYKFLEATKHAFIDTPASQRLEIALYLVPQIEAAFETMSQLCVDTKVALEQIISSSNSSGKGASSESGKKPVKEMLGKSVRQILHMRELMKLRIFHEKITLAFMNMMQKKTNFVNMTSATKVRAVSKNLEQIIDEIPMFMVRLEGLMATLDDRLTWRGWKYTFKLGTSKVAWMLQTLVSHRPILKSMISQVIEMVHRDHFTQSMILLGLLDPPPDQESPPSSSTPTTPPRTPSPITSRLSSLDSLSVPPLASESTLAKNAVQLLKSEQRADMTFEIVCVEDVSDTVIDHTHGEPVGHTTQEQEVEVHHIRAHCIIIASRCDWFRRALLSGMRESIDKKIIVHDTNPALFKVFLEYLYGGTLDTSSLSMDQLADLMLLSDRYEVDCLKQLCESTLKRGICHDSALFLLSMADQFNAKTLKSAAMEFIAENPDIIEGEIFDELPEDLRAEVDSTLSWTRSKRQESCGRKLQRTDGIRHHGCCNFRNSKEVEDMLSSMQLSRPSREMDPTDTSSLEDAPLTQDSAQLEACVAQLRDIVGETVPHDELVRVSLAADYNVNRAINFFFA